MSDIRVCTPEDLPAVAGLFQNTFRDPYKRAPTSLRACLREIYFAHPWRDPELLSQVYVTPDGKVRGFLGIVPLHMSFQGHKVRAAVLSSLMIDKPHKRSHAGVKLLRAFLSGPQEISISEPAGAITQHLWEKMGGQAVPSESMEWLRIFRPAGLVLSLAAGRFALAKLAGPLALLVDGIASKSLRVDTSAHVYARDADLSDDDLLHFLPKFAEAYALHPDWDSTCLKFMLAHAAQNRGRGTLYRRIVYGNNDVPLGCYLYHGRPGHIAWVLQILAHQDAMPAVLDSLFAHAYVLGAVALKGRTQLRLLDPLLHRGCIFFRRHGALIHSRNPELLAAVRSGEAITSGLAAESWMRLIGDTFV